VGSVIQAHSFMVADEFCLRKQFRRAHFGENVGVVGAFAEGRRDAVIAS
jgi:hypothetical protein